jgi:ribosomal protein L11 methyltransferase
MVVRAAAVRTDELIDVLWRLGALAIEERPGGGETVLTTAFPSDRATAAAAARVAALGFSAAVVDVDEGEYLDAWRPHATAVRVGQLVVEPAWLPSTALPGEVAVRIDPGRSFGSGGHATSRLVLAALVRHVSTGCTVLDVGCGSGLLGIAAALLGAGRITAIDVDPEAVTATRANAGRNGVAIDVSSTPLATIEGTFDVVVANILAPVLLALAGDLVRVVAPGGVLVVSGLLAGRSDHVAQALAPLVVDRTDGLDGWVAVTLRREAEQSR